MKAEEKAKRDIYAWLDSRNYQTEYEETGEYKMYFACDMPKILEAYHQYASQTEMPSEEKVYKLVKKAYFDASPMMQNEKDTEINFNKWFKSQLKGGE